MIVGDKTVCGKKLYDDNENMLYTGSKRRIIRRCDLCGREDPRDIEGILRRREKNELRIDVCNECKWFFNSGMTVDEYKQYKHDIKNLKCKDCGIAITRGSIMGRCGPCSVLQKVGKKRPKEVGRKISKSLTGKKLTEEHKKSLSISHKGYIMPLEQRRKISESNKGRVVSKETREKIGNKNRDKRASDETKRKIKEARKRQVIPPESYLKAIKTKEKNGTLYVFGKICKYRGYILKSTYELKRAKFLDENNITWKYEEITYNLGDTTYTPDFFIYDKSGKLIRIEEIKSTYTYKLKKEKIERFLDMFTEEAKIYVLLFEEDLHILREN